MIFSPASSFTPFIITSPFPRLKKHFLRFGPHPRLRACMLNSLLKLHPRPSIMSLLRPLPRHSSLPNLKPLLHLALSLFLDLYLSIDFSFFPNRDLCLASGLLLFKSLLGGVPLPAFHLHPAFGLLLNLDHLSLKLLH